MPGVHPERGGHCPGPFCVQRYFTCANKRRIAYAFPITRKVLSKYTLLIALPLALATSCGGSDGSDDETFSVAADTTMTTANISKPQFIARVNRICRQAWVTIVGNFSEYSSTQSPEYSTRKRFNEAVRLSLIAGITFHIFDNIYNLGAPEGEERTTEEIIGSMQYASESGEKNLVPLFSIAQVSELYSDYNQRARLYGLDDCLVDLAHLKKLSLSDV